MALLRNSGKCKNGTLIILLNGPLVEEAILVHLQKNFYLSLTTIIKK